MSPNFWNRFPSAGKATLISSPKNTEILFRIFFWGPFFGRLNICGRTSAVANSNHVSKEFNLRGSCLFFNASKVVELARAESSM